MSLKRAIKLIKKLGLMPPNILTPDELAGYFYMQYNSREYAGIEAVGGGEGWLGYTPLGIKYDQIIGTSKIAVVGKGITFDSGGISAKPSEGMWKMKCDMLGAATALALQYTVKDLRVDLYGCIAENTPRTNGIRPSDVLTYVDGTKVEVVDTDAEGRLVLADGILAAKENNPELIITIATLTGAARTVFPATVMFSNNEKLARKFEESAKETGEKLVRFPIYDEHRNDIKGKKGVADIKNLGSIAGACTAAAFLEHFVGDVSWIHLDIAGSATDKNDNPTGAMLATLIHFINNWR